MNCIHREYIRRKKCGVIFLVPNHLSLFRCHICVKAEMKIRKQNDLYNRIAELTETGVVEKVRKKIKYVDMTVANILMLIETFLAKRRNFFCRFYLFFSLSTANISIFGMINTILQSLTVYAFDLRSDLP